MFISAINLVQKFMSEITIQCRLTAPEDIRHMLWLLTNGGKKYSANQRVIQTTCRTPRFRNMETTRKTTKRTGQNKLL